jgi:hypothetical protein
LRDLLCIGRCHPKILYDKIWAFAKYLIKTLHLTIVTHTSEKAYMN